MTWDPDDVNASVGDVIEWKMGAGNPGDHGVRITNWATVKDHVEVEQGDDRQRFNEMTGRNDTPTDIAERLLLRLKVKSAPPAPAEIKYNCIVHGLTMSGKVSVSP
ncbi:MAG: hypothetical protein WBC44_06930 [Planctomycetaceae bacterium]